MVDDNSYQHADEVLLGRLAKGDQAAFADLYRRYQGGLVNYLFKFTKNAAQSEDFVHDIFLKIWDLREQVEIKSSFSSYLYRAARNKAINQLTNIALQNNIKDEILHRNALLTGEQTLLNNLQWQQYERLLKKAIDSLTPQRKQAFIICREQGHSYEEAASIMHLSRNTIKEHLVLAVKSIKQYMLEHGEIILMLVFAILN